MTIVDRPALRSAVERPGDSRWLYLGSADGYHHFLEQSPLLGGWADRALYKLPEAAMQIPSSFAFAGTGRDRIARTVFMEWGKNANPPPEYVIRKSLEIRAELEAMPDGQPAR